MKTELGASKMVQWVRTLATKPEFAPQNRFDKRKKVSPISHLTRTCISRHATSLLTSYV